MYLTELDDPIGDDYAAHKALSAICHEQKILFLRRGQRSLVLSKNAINGKSRNVGPVLRAVKPGEEFLFVIRLNPVVTRFVDGKNRRVAIDSQKIRAWLAGVFMKNGFTAEYTFKTEGIRRSAKNNDSISLFSVLVSGVMTVADVDLFIKAVEKGIGHGKGLGFGLLNIFDFA